MSSDTSGRDIVLFFDSYSLGLFLTTPSIGPRSLFHSITWFDVTEVGSEWVLCFYAAPAFWMSQMFL